MAKVTRSDIRRRRRPATLDVLPQDRARRAGTLDGIRIDGRAIDLLVGDRFTGARYRPTIEGANTVELDLWDGDRRVLTSGVLGRRVMTRVAEIHVDGLTYTVSGFSRSGNSLTVSCEDAVVTHLKRDGRDKPRSSTRGKDTRAGFCGDLIRRAGVPCIVLDEEVVQPRAGARKLRDELARARRDVSGDRETRGRSSTVGLTARGLTVKGVTMDKEQRRNAATILEVAGETDATDRPLVGAFCAAIGESALRKGAVNGIHKGVFQSAQIPASDLRAQARHFFIGGRSFLAGGAIGYARANPSASPGTIATKVEISDGSAGYYDSFADEARAIVQAGGRIVDTADLQSGAAWVNSYQFHRQRNESTWTCVRRLLDEVRWRVFVREGVAVIASEPALARALPGLVLTSDLLNQDDFEQHRALRVGEASLSAWVGRYDADPGETVEIDTVPQLDAGPGDWVIASATVDLLADLAPVEIACRLPQQPLAEPSSTVAKRDGDRADDSVGGGGSGGGVRDECQRISDAKPPYLWGGAHGPQLSTVGSSDGMDCSSSCSLALFRAGVFGSRTAALVSGEFAASYGKPGRGKDWTVWANAGHMFIQGDGWRFDTGGPGGGNGARLHTQTRPTAGFTPRHITGR